MKLPLAYYGNPILRVKTKAIEKIDETIKQLIADMIETMEANDGIGLAAPQVCQALALFITQVPVRKADDPEEWENGESRVFINPKIVSRSDEEECGSEGCLSIPKLYADVYRPFKITLQYTDVEGKEHTETFEGLAARVIMHENDHINGTLFIDRVGVKKRQELENTLRAIKKKYHLAQKG